MRCADCINGEIDPAECCDLDVAEHVEYLEGFAADASALAAAATGVVAALQGNDPTALDASITTLIEADYARQACGGVIDGLVDERGSQEHRAQRRLRPW